MGALYRITYSEDGTLQWEGLALSVDDAADRYLQALGYDSEAQADDVLGGDKGAWRSGLVIESPYCVACAMTAGEESTATRYRRLRMAGAPRGFQPVCEQCAAELDRTDEAST